MTQTIEGGVSAEVADLQKLASSPVFYGPEITDYDRIQTMQATSPSFKGLPYGDQLQVYKKLKSDYQPNFINQTIKPALKTIDKGLAHADAAVQGVTHPFIGTFTAGGTDAVNKLTTGLTQRQSDTQRFAQEEQRLGLKPGSLTHLYQNPVTNAIGSGLGFGGGLGPVGNAKFAPGGFGLAEKVASQFANKVPQLVKATGGLNFLGKLATGSAGLGVYEGARGAAADIERHGFNPASNAQAFAQHGLQGLGTGALYEAGLGAVGKIARPYMRRFGTGKGPQTSFLDSIASKLAADQAEQRAAMIRANKTSVNPLVVGKINGKPINPGFIPQNIGGVAQRVVARASKDKIFKEPDTIVKNAQAAAQVFQDHLFAQDQLAAAKKSLEKLGLTVQAGESNVRDAIGRLAARIKQLEKEIPSQVAALEKRYPEHTKVKIQKRLEQLTKEHVKLTGEIQERQQAHDAYKEAVQLNRALHEGKLQSPLPETKTIEGKAHITKSTADQSPVKITIAGQAEKSSEAPPVTAEVPVETPAAVVPRGTHLPQNPVNTDKQKLLWEVAHLIPDKLAGLAQDLNKAIEGKAIARVKYVAEETGRSNEAAKATHKGNIVTDNTDFSPTHWRETKDGKVMIAGYNQRGHEVSYHLDKSPKGSYIESATITNKPALTGPTPNRVHGAATYDAHAYENRGDRTAEGFTKTSDAKKALAQLAELYNSDVFSKLSKPVQDLLRSIKKNGRITLADLKQIEKLIGKDAEQLKILCNLLGLH